MDAWEILNARGFVKQVSDADALAAAFRKGPVTFYCGFDPTADSLHVGHITPVMAMAHLQRAGHVPIAVVGGGTGMVGDPSGKTEMREILTPETIARNLTALRFQLGKFLVLDGVAGHMVDNADWLLPLNYIAFLRDIGRHFSVNRMLSMEAYKLRLERGQGLSFIEFNYQLLQAYDFLELYRRHRCTLQIGGDDQWGNILAGADLIRRVDNAEAFALTFPLITTASGAKMGKTAGGAVWLDPARTSPFELFQYWLNVDDRDVGRFLRLYTFLPLDEIVRYEALQGAELREGKRALARAFTALVHGDDAAQQADAGAQAMAKGEATADLPTCLLLPEDAKFIDALVRAGLAKSKSDARRLIEGGGVSLGADKVTEREAALPALPAGGGVLRVGKSKAVRIVRAP